MKRMQRDGMNELRLTLPAIDASTGGNWRGHTLSHARAVRDARNCGHMAVVAMLAGRAAPRLKAPNARIQYTVVLGPGQRRMDDDNVIAAMKPYRDGIADGLGCNDALWQTQPVTYERGPRGGVKVFVEWGDR